MGNTLYSHSSFNYYISSQAHITYNSMVGVLYVTYLGIVDEILFSFMFLII